MKPRHDHVPPDDLFLPPVQPRPALARRHPTTLFGGRVLLAYGLAGMIATFALCAVFLAGAKFEQHRHSAFDYGFVGRH
jgi:hypothetical protein